MAAEHRGRVSRFQDSSRPALDFVVTVWARGGGRVYPKHTFIFVFIS